MECKGHRHYGSCKRSPRGSLTGKRAYYKYVCHGNGRGRRFFQIRSDQSPIADYTNELCPSPRAVQNMGVIYHGRIGAVDYFTYAANFKVGKSAIPVWPAKKVVFGASNSGARMMYALPEHEEAVATDRFPDSYMLDDPSGTIIQLHSAPLANPHYIDGFYTAKVLN